MTITDPQRLADAMDSAIQTWHRRTGQTPPSAVLRAAKGPHNGKKTHCKRGHEFTEDNTIRTSTGRRCRACDVARRPPPKPLDQRDQRYSRLRDPALAEQARSLYESGLTLTQVGEALGFSQRTAWDVLRNHGVERRVGTDRRTGSARPGWKGDEASYEAFHRRVVAARGRPAECNRCGVVGGGRKYEWANLTGKYEDVADYERMCKPCHRRYDDARRAATGLLTSTIRGEQVPARPTTHCPNGHEYTPANTREPTRGDRRRCRECKRAQGARRPSRRMTNTRCEEQHPFDDTAHCRRLDGHSGVHAADGKAWETTTDPKDTR